MDPITIVIYASIYVGLVATSFYALSYISGRKYKPKLFSDKELPTVTVAIPAYNEENSIEDTIKSILKSDYPKDKLEILVIDNNSTDNTLKLAKKFEKFGVKVLQEKKKGKGHALNLAIKKSTGEIFFSMDADTFVEPHSVKEMARHFKNKDVMCVSPAIVVYKPKTILQLIQHAEYLFGLFLRKAFSSVNALHITPGAFSAYRKSFFKKHGGYEVGNITEDLELALRIQTNGYLIANCPEAPAYTIAPKKFHALTKQRMRWYTGLMKNTWKYRRIINPKYGDLGIFVIPIAWISIFFSVFVVTYLAIKTLFNIREEILFLNSIDFNFSSLLNINFYILERFFFQIFTNPVFVFILIFMVFLGFYLNYARKKLPNTKNVLLSVPFYFVFFALLFGFWWLISIIHNLLGRKIKWK